MTPGLRSIGHSIHPWLWTFIGVIAASSPGVAQQTGTVVGQSTSSESGDAIPYALVHLLPSSSPEVPSRGVVTSSDGSFRFADVPAGEYRLKLQRIGYVSAPSSPFLVRSGEVLHYDLRSEAVPVQIEGLRIVGNECYTRGNLQDVPDLAVLWNEAEKGVETQGTFLRQHRFTVDLRVQSTERRRGGTQYDFSTDTTIVLPSTHPVRITTGSIVLRFEPPRRDPFASERFGSASSVNFRVGMPDESAILSSTFLVEYCLENRLDTQPDGALAIHFRPVRRGRGNRIDVIGTIFLEPETYLLRAMRYEYYEGNRHSGTGTIQFTDVQVPGGKVRTSTSLELSYRPSGLQGLLIPEFRSTLMSSNLRNFLSLSGPGR